MPATNPGATSNRSIRAIINAGAVPTAAHNRRQHGRREAPGQGSAFAEATAQEAAAGSGLSSGRRPQNSWGRLSVFHAARRRTSENQAPVRQGNFWDRVSASCPQAQGIRARRPRIQVSSSISALWCKVRPISCPHGTRGERLMEYHDKVLKCAECGAEFVFTGGEQMFFADKGFKNEPKRCKACKAK